MPAVELSDLPTFPGYEILGELGRGGMGVVYRAFDVKRQKVVALKTMQWIEPALLYHFKQEFRTLADLTHPNLVALHELVSDGRQWFFTMELLDGKNFLAHVRAADCDAEVPATVASAAVIDKWGTVPNMHEPRHAAVRALSPRGLDCLRDVLRQLARGVLALHHAGKLHRDIKPGNVLVTRQGRVVLLDFGLAAELDRSGKHASTVPHVLGTIAYMAPEQAAAQPLTMASDWYAVGVMLFEALTGVLPFDGPTLEVMVNKQSREAPVPRTLAPEAPEDLNALAVALLQRRPEARPTGPEVLRWLGGDKMEPCATVAAHVPATAQGTLIGRKQHLAALADAFHALRKGQTIVLHVRGRSGVGKSALVRSFLDRLCDDGEAVVLMGRCYEQEAVPYKALDSLVDALSRYLHRLPALQAEALLPRDVLALARVFPVLRRVEAIAQAPRRPLDATDAQEMRRRALAALRELLGRLGDRRPLVLFIDDLQWGDADSAALLGDLLRPPESPTLLLVVAYRSEEAAASPCLRALLAPAAQKGMVDRRELAVEPLTPGEGRELALTLLDPTLPDLQLRAETISREAGGNPFFVFELVQHLQKANASLPANTAPSSAEINLGDVLWERVARLPAAARRILEVLAVAGRPLRQTEAGEAAGSACEASAAVAELRTARFLRSTGPAERDEIETYHDRIRETVVARLTPETLQHHHAALARVMASSGQVDPERLAIHYQGAGDPAQAGKQYALAASQAADALAFDRAAKLYRLALQLLKGQVADERPSRTRLGDALANAGRGGEAAREYLAASAGAAPAEALELQRRAAMQFLVSGHIDDGLAALRGVLDAVGMRMPATPRRAFWSLVLRRLQLRLRGLGYRPHAAAEVPPEVLSRINICWSASAGLSMVDTIQGAYFQTRGLLLALAAGEPNHLARGLAMEAGHVSIGGGRSQKRAAQLLQAADALARQVDQPYPHGAVAMIKGVAAALAGNWRASLGFCDRAEAIFRGSCTGAVWELDTTHRFLLRVLMFMGEVAELSRRLPLLLKEAEERDDLYALTNLGLMVGTFVRLAADEPEQALDTAAEHIARWSRQGFHVQHMDHMYDEAQIGLYRGEGRLAWDRLNERWPKVAESHFFRVQQVRVYMGFLRARTALAAAASVAQPQRFLREADQGGRLLAKERVPWSGALAQLVYAGAATVRRAADAPQLLRVAAAALAAIDMPLHAAAARHLQGRVIGGDEGRALLAQAESWMKEQSIRTPVRMAAMLAPGLPD